MSNDKYAKYSSKGVTYSSNGRGARYSNVDNGVRDDNKGCSLIVLLPLLITLSTIAIKLWA